MAVPYIGTHQADALGRLLEQYKGKPFLSGLLNAMNAQTQAIEDTFAAIYLARGILTSSGAQLDALGAVVGLPRTPGMSDATYQSLILAEVGLNTSQGTPESVLSAFGLFTGSSKVDFYELPPANVALMGNGQLTSQTLIDGLTAFCLAILPAGVSIDYFGYFDPANAFAFSGGGPTDGGFGDVNDLTVGGKFAALYVPNVIYFGFDGDGGIELAGFGDANDPAVGGQFFNFSL